MEVEGRCLISDTDANGREPTLFPGTESRRLDFLVGWEDLFVGESVRLYLVGCENFVLLAKENLTIPSSIPQYQSKLDHWEKARSGLDAEKDAEKGPSYFQYRFEKKRSRLHL